MKYILALNFYMGRASAKTRNGVRSSTERQTSDCDVKCRITFSFQWKFHVYGSQLGWKTSTIILLKQCKILRRVFIYLGFIFILYDNLSLDRAAKHYGRFTQFFAWRLCSSPECPLYAYVSSLELADLVWTSSNKMQEVGNTEIKTKQGILEIKKSKKKSK